ncbi:MAG TPA: NADH:flavin oxidoreductase [Terriglobia bacterium]|nr:NADH:flavin oxidoreductase [Terriglobia bacterium]
MAPKSFPRVASFRTARSVGEYLAGLGYHLPCDEDIQKAPSSPLAQPLEIPWRTGHFTIGNRFAVQPMEGWDGEVDGHPSDLTRRRWLRFAQGGAKLIWGCEAVAVLPEARANPNQLVLNEQTAGAFETLLQEMRKAHEERFGSNSDLLIGLQLTHSGRFSRPHEKGRLEPIIAYHHPILDPKLRIPSCHSPVSETEIERIVRAFGRAARLARDTGFDFVDLKHCHGYLGHEFLSAYTRSGSYGGDFENRTRFLKETVAATRDSAKGIEIGVRLSAFDSVPFAEEPASGTAIPVIEPGLLPYTWGFGLDPAEPWKPDLSEAKLVISLLTAMGVKLVNVSASSPYYAPHLQRPALFPPSDGYPPPEDPLVGAARLVLAARDLKHTGNGVVVVSSGWTYFQNFLPHFAQAAVREHWTDLVGLGRMMLSYPDLPADALQKGRMDPKRLCRTFSDCTTGPRNGLISGCYPLDNFYKGRPEAARLQSIKEELRRDRRADSVPT